MAANLDKKNTLRLIGVQIFEKTSTEVRKTLKPGWFPFIKCSNSKDIGTSKDKFPEVDPEVCPRDFYSIYDDLPTISISAIVGKNGSGKSSLMEIVYLILNNFAERIIRCNDETKPNQLEKTEEIEARLYFELDSVLKFIDCTKEDTLYYKVVNNNGEIEVKKEPIDNLDDDQRNELLSGFFYTIILDYSLFGLNPLDYKSPNIASCLNRLFNKTDDYYIPLVLTPYRKDGQININYEKSLAKKRIEALSLLFHSQKKEFLNDYEPYKFKYNFNDSYKENKLKDLQFRPVVPELINVQYRLIEVFEVFWEKYLKKYRKVLNKVYIDEKKGFLSKRSTILFYLAYNSLKICAKDAFFRKFSSIGGLINELGQFSELRFKKVPGAYNDNDILKLELDKSVVEVWCNAHKHEIKLAVTKIAQSPLKYPPFDKIHNTLDYLCGKTYQDIKGFLDVNTELLKGNEFKTYNEILELLPPIFFNTELFYKKKGKVFIDGEEGITLQSMSSGERQMLHSLSYILYHIKKIADIKDEKERRRVGYHHINLIFDEAELYFHPEFQRKFVRELLEALSYLHINKSNTIIKSINIIIITHSPFILSDIPQSNVLFLDREYVSKEEMPQTLGANIYDILKSGFFLDYAIGDVVQKKLKDILNLYYMKDDPEKITLFERNKDEYWYTISHLGEEYIRKKFKEIYHQMEITLLDTNQKKKRIENQIKFLKEEIIRLKKQSEDYEKN